MEKCQKCNGVMLQMKPKRTTLLPDSEKKQEWKCSRCGYYAEKTQTQVKRYGADDLHGATMADDDDFPYLRRR